MVGGTAIAGVVKRVRTVVGGNKRGKSGSISFASRWYFALVIESAVAGFYVAITRGLAPILLAFKGFTVQQIVLFNIAAYSATLGLLCYIQKHGIKMPYRVLLLSHGVERVAWGVLPITALLGPAVLVVNYSAAIALAALTGVLLILAIYSFPDEKTARRIIALRASASAASNVIGQLTAITVLSAVRSYMKYVYLYSLASSIGLIATAIVFMARLPLPEKIRPAKPAGSESDMAVSAAVFTYMVAYMASTSVLAVAWAPYLIHVLRAPDYVAAGLGFAQTVTSMAVSPLWLRSSYSTYKYAIALLPLVPVAVITVKQPPLHIALASFYAFSAAGTNLLASFMYADMSKKLGAFTSSLKVVSASTVAQIIGLSTAFAASKLGMGAIFLSSTAYALVAAFIAFYSLPEVALVPPDQAVVHARRLYLVALTASGFIVIATKKTVLLTLRILALTLALLLTLLVYKILYYLVFVIH